MHNIQTVKWNLWHDKWKPHEYLICHSIEACGSMAKSMRDNQDNKTNKWLNESTIKIFHLPPLLPPPPLKNPAWAPTTSTITIARMAYKNETNCVICIHYYSCRLLNENVQISILLSLSLWTGNTVCKRHLRMAKHKWCCYRNGKALLYRSCKSKRYIPQMVLSAPILSVIIAN